MNDTTTVTAGQLDVGDVVSLPGFVAPCRVRAVRTTVPGVVWLYLDDSGSDSRLRRRTSVPLNQEVVLHASATDRAAESGERPDDA